MKIPSLRGGPLVATLIVSCAALCGLAPVTAKTPPGQAKKNPTTAAVTATTYSGRATAVRIDDVHEPIPGPIIIADTGPLPSSGGLLEASENDYVLYGTDGVTVALGIEAAYSVTAGSGAEASSDTSLSGFQVRFDTPQGNRVTITADYIAASTRAFVTGNCNASAEGSISVVNLQINGVPVVVTGEPNQIVPVPDGYIVFNEQTVVIGDGEADIMITAMHVYIHHCMNGSFGTVKSGITCGDEPPPPHEGDCGKLTGGGWIVTPSGAKGTFGVSGGIRRGEFWGHLQYNDHGSGLKVKSTAVTGFETSPDDPNCRIITYQVEINGSPGTAVVEACDHGEPGRNDTFSIQLSTGYSAGGSLGGDRPGGGNIQLHKCPPGWER